MANATFLDPHPAESTEAEPIDLLAVADGAILTHVLTEDERSRGVLAVDGDLELWARLAEAQEGVPLCSGGVLRTQRVQTLGDVPGGASVGLVGPDGWLAAYEPGALLGLRLAGGTLYVVAFEEPPDPDGRQGERIQTVLEACHAAVLTALDSFHDRSVADPAADPRPSLVEVLAELLADHPGALRAALPPFGQLLALGGMEAADGSIGLASQPWDGDTDGLAPVEIEALTQARTYLRQQIQLYHLEPEPPVDGIPVFLRVLSAPVVLERIADEIEAYPPPDRLLEALRTGAQTREQRAVAALLSARAAEGHRDTGTAQTQLLAALAERDDLVPALRDAASYAADRGDAAAADAFLRRAGTLPEHPVRRALHKLLTPAPSRTPRNRPCPCGSGRKHKACCLPQVRHPLPQRAPLVYTRIAEYAQRGANSTCYRAYLARCNGVVPLLALDLAIFEGGLLGRYLDARGHLLPDDERELVEAWRTTPLAAYEVITVRRELGVTLRRLPDGQTVRLRDRSFATGIQHLDLLLARVLTDSAAPRLIAPPHRVFPTHREALLELLDGGYEPEQLAAFFSVQPRNREGADDVEITAG
ncbi:MAG: SEC-C domain-containing protein [Pseudonocardiales bacterium]